VAALLERCALAGAPAAIALLSSRCAALTLAMPPPPERRPSEVGAAAAAAAAAASATLGGGSARAADPDVVKELDLDKLAAGTVTRLRVRLAESALGEPMAVPVLVAKGGHAGPVLGITSAVRPPSPPPPSALSRLRWRALTPFPAPPLPPSPPHTHT
jgi:hypothetical protein